MSSSFRAISALTSNGSRASAGLFFEATARTTPAVGQLLGVLLEGAERLAVGALAQADPERPGLADDPAPERVVQVEHEHLLRPGRQGPDAGPEVLGQARRARPR